MKPSPKRCKGGRQNTWRVVAGLLCGTSVEGWTRNLPLAPRRSTRNGSSCHSKYCSTSTVTSSLYPKLCQSYWALRSQAPDATDEAVSPARHSRQDVLNAMDLVFPPQALDQRMALSRKDGYWPFVSSGDEPPQEFVYGEFDLDFFAEVLQIAGSYLQESNGNSQSNYDDWVFCDLGSGTGRLVLTAAALYPWKLCRGIELLEGIHAQALETYEKCRQGASTLSSPQPMSETSTISATLPTREESSSSEDAYSQQYKQYMEAATKSPTNEASWINDLSSQFGGESSNPETMTLQDNGLYMPTAPVQEGSSVAAEPDSEKNDDTEETEETIYCLPASSTNINPLPLSPIAWSCGSFTDPYEYFADANIIFVFSSAMPYHILVDLAYAAGRQCLPGTLIITTEYQLPLGGEIQEDPDDPELPFGSFELELVDTVHGSNDSTGGQSTVYIQKLVKSLGDGQRRSKKPLPVSEQAFRVIQQLEAGQLNDPESFVRNVSNQMAFLGLPEKWRPSV